MEPNQPTPSGTTTIYVPNDPANVRKPSGLPTTVAFVVAVLLFLLPFVDIQCGGMSIKQISGVQLATGYSTSKSSSNALFNDVSNDTIDEGISKTTTKSSSKDINMYAAIALGLAILGLALSFSRARAAIGGAMACGIAGAAALIGLMIDIKKKVSEGIPGTNQKVPEGSVGDKVNDLTDSVKDLTDKISVNFTTWFYIAVVALIAAAVVSYLRMKKKP